MFPYYCLQSRKNTESKNPKVRRTKNENVMFLSKLQEASGLWSSLGIKTPLSKIPLVGPLKQVNQVNVLSAIKLPMKQVSARYKMNEIVKRFLLAGDTYMP